MASCDLTEPSTADAHAALSTRLQQQHAEEVGRLTKQLAERDAEIERLKREEDHWSRECHRAAREKVEITKQRDSALARVAELESQLTRYKAAVAAQLKFDMASVLSGMPEERMVAERDDLRSKLESAEARTAEAIAAWLEQNAEHVGYLMAGHMLTEAAEQIRAGRWRPR